MVSGGNVTGLTDRTDRWLGAAGCPVLKPPFDDRQLTVAGRKQNVPADGRAHEPGWWKCSPATALTKGMRSRAPWSVSSSSGPKVDALGRSRPVQASAGTIARKFDDLTSRSHVGGRESPPAERVSSSEFPLAGQMAGGRHCIVDRLRRKNPLTFASYAELRDLFRQLAAMMCTPS